MQKSKDMNRRPIHPGEILREEFMREYDLTVNDLAENIGVSRQSVYELISEKRSMSTEMALRLAYLFDVSPELWLNIQRKLDLWLAEQKLTKELEQIAPLSA